MAYLVRRLFQHTPFEKKTTTLLAKKTNCWIHYLIARRQKSLATMNLHRFNFLTTLFNPYLENWFVLLLYPWIITIKRLSSKNYEHIPAFDIENAGKNCYFLLSQFIFLPFYDRPLIFFERVDLRICDRCFKFILRDWTIK